MIDAQASYYLDGTGLLGSWQLEYRQAHCYCAINRGFIRKSEVWAEVAGICGNMLGVWELCTQRERAPGQEVWGKPHES